VRVSKHTKPDWSQVATILIAFLALGLSMYEFRAARQHERLSVKPILQFERVNAPVEGYPQPGIHLVNCGNGVALLESLTVYVDGKPVQPAGQASVLEETTRTLGLLEGQDFQVAYSISLAQALPAQQRRLLIGMKNGGDYTPERGAVLNGALARVEARVTYRSLYGDAYESALTRP